jgi:hypothetical protein
MAILKQHSADAISMLDLGNHPLQFLHATRPHKTSKQINSIKVEIDRSIMTGSNSRTKSKVSRERQLKINAASRKCRRKQKVELQFLRGHVADLRKAMYEHGKCCPVMDTSLLEKTEVPMQEFTSIVRSTSCSSTTTTSSSSSSCSATLLHGPLSPNMAMTGSSMHHHESSDDSDLVKPPPPASAMSQSSHTISELVTIGSFMRMNINLESKTFCPDTISSLPIHMDGWIIRLSITERNYAFFNSKFFPCRTRDLFDFIWESNLNETTSFNLDHSITSSENSLDDQNDPHQHQDHNNDYCKVTKLNSDMAYVVSKTVGKWSWHVHGVPNVSYNSIVARLVENDGSTGAERYLVCQQSVLGASDFANPNIEPWLFKRWVVFRSATVDGVSGTIVEAHRAASYASGRKLYSETNTYDSFCEHIIRRYAESNTMLERNMMLDPRFSSMPRQEHTFFDVGDTTVPRALNDFLML